MLQRSVFINETIITRNIPRANDQAEQANAVLSINPDSWQNWGLGVHLGKVKLINRNILYQFCNLFSSSIFHRIKVRWQIVDVFKYGFYFIIRFY